MTLNEKIEQQIKAHTSENALGETQYWIYLKSGRSVEVCFESHGLPAGECYYSVRFHCSDKEFNNGEFQNACGIIDTIVTRNCKLEEFKYAQKAIRDMVIKHKEEIEENVSVW